MSPTPLTQSEAERAAADLILDRPLDRLETLSLEEASKPAVYYALCREAERHGINVSLDADDAIPTIAGLIEAVLDARRNAS